MRQRGLAVPDRSGTPPTGAGALEEWRRCWPLPFVAAIGASSSVLPIYTLGAFMRPLQEAFGFSRATVVSGMTLANVIAGATAVLVGILIDRLGPRRIGIFGVATICIMIALLSTTSGTLTDWYGHWAMVGIGMLLVQSTIWVGAVSSRFQASRGLALAIAMCGTGLSASLMPILSIALIERFGWRMAFVCLGAIWAIVALPMLLIWFRGAADVPVVRGSGGVKVVPSAILPGFTVREGLRRASFYKIAFAGAVYAFVLIAVVVHFVPILQDHGRDGITAGAIAGMIGIASIFGRLSTGFLLDRFRGDRVAPAAFLLPTLGLALLLADIGTGGEVAAAIIIGLSVGAELDIIAYLASRHLGLKHFGVLFSLMMIGLAASTALGPMVAGAVYDAGGSYAPFLLGGMPGMAAAAAALFTLGRYPAFESDSGSTATRSG